MCLALKNICGTVFFPVRSCTSCRHWGYLSKLISVYGTFSSLSVFLARMQWGHPSMEYTSTCPFISIFLPSESVDNLLYVYTTPSTLVNNPDCHRFINHVDMYTDIRKISGISGAEHDSFYCRSNTYRGRLKAINLDCQSACALIKKLLGTVHLIFWGGGGGPGIFWEKKFLALILTKKNKLAQWHSEKIICLQ